MTAPTVDPRERLVDAACIAAGLLLAIFMLFGTGGPVRVLVALLFCIVGPGWPLSRWLRGREFVMRLTVAIGLSVSVIVLIAEVMIVLGWWQPTGAMVFIALGTSAAQGFVTFRRSQYWHDYTDARDLLARTSDDSTEPADA